MIGTDRVASSADARVYRHGLSVLGAEPAQATMVAAHWWDLRGARAVGMRVAGVARGEGALSPLLPDPDAQGADLLPVAHAPRHSRPDERALLLDVVDGRGRRDGRKGVPSSSMVVTPRRPPAAQPSSAVQSQSQLAVVARSRKTSGSDADTR